LKKTDKQRIATILNSFQHGTSFYHRNDVEFKQWKVMPPSHYEAAINLFNTAISRGLGIPDLLGFTTTGTGSFALGKEQAALFYGLIGADRDSLVNLINYALIPKLEDINYEPNGKYSYMEVSRVKIKDFTTILDVYKGAYEAAGYNPGDLSDLNRFRSQLGFDEIKPENHEEYLETWNNIRRVGRGQEKVEAGDVIVDGNGFEVSTKKTITSDVNDDFKLMTNPSSMTPAEHVDNLSNKYRSNYAVNVEKDFNELSNQYETLIYSSIEELSDAALRETVSLWNDNDIEIQSKILELKQKGSLAKRIQKAHKEAHQRGMDSALKEIEDIVNEGVVDND